MRQLTVEGTQSQRWKDVLTWHVSIARPPRGIIHVSSRFRRDPRALEEEEETWFDQDDDEEQNGGDDVMTAVKSPEDNFKSYNSFPIKNDVLSPSTSNKVYDKC